MFTIPELKNIEHKSPTQAQLKHMGTIQQAIQANSESKNLPNFGVCFALSATSQRYVTIPGKCGVYAANYFRYLAFRPGIGSALTGKIRSCTPEGVHVTLGLFDNILIPPTALRQPSRFDAAAQTWVWERQLNDNEKQDFYMNIGDRIKFCVLSETFEKKLVTDPPLNNDNAQQQPGPTSEAQATTENVYKIIGVINAPGLGVLSWFDQPKE